MKENLPQRRRTRLQNYDYSLPGAYFVTVCTQQRREILSKIVGDGAPDVPKIELTETGRRVEKILLDSEKIPGVRIDRYVLMPDHLHVIIFLDPSVCAEKRGTSGAPSPTNEMLSRVISAFKRFCTKELGDNPFQRSFYDHIIRDRADYDEHIRYILENPMRRYFREKANEKSPL